MSNISAFPDDINTTASNLSKQNKVFSGLVDTLYRNIDVARTNAWQGGSAEGYYTSIVGYKQFLTELGENLDNWVRRTQNVAENWYDSSSRINSEVSKLG